MATGALLPVTWGTPVGTTSGPVLPSNPSRTGLIFVNASVSQAIAIIPAVANIALLQGQYPSAPVTPSVAVINGAGSVTMQPGDKFIIDNLNCTCAWNGIASGTGAVLSMLES